MLPDQALGVAADAAKLLVAGLVLLYRVEEGQGDAHGGHLDLRQVLSLKRTKLGFWGGGNLFLARCTLKVAIIEAAKEEGDLRSWPRTSTSTPKSSAYAPRKTSARIVLKGK